MQLVLRILLCFVKYKSYYSNLEAYSHISFVIKLHETAGRWSSELCNGFSSSSGHDVRPVLYLFRPHKQFVILKQIVSSVLFVCFGFEDCIYMLRQVYARFTLNFSSVYIYIYIYIYTHIHTYVRTYVCMYVCMYVHKWSDNTVKNKVLFCYNFMILDEVAFSYNKCATLLFKFEFNSLKISVPLS
jgi:hypothetical protein